MRLFRLGAPSYWLDEILQTYWMNGDWHFLWRSIRFDAGHPPFDYLIARCLEILAPTDAARKIPVVVWGLGTVVSFGLLTARRSRPRTGLIAAALLAFAPFHVRYSQELRPYSLSLFLLCLSLLLLERFLEKPGPVRLVLLFLAVEASVYTSYILQVVLALAAAALLVEDAVSADPVRRARSRRFLAWSPLFIALTIVAYLPWLRVQLEAARRTPVHAQIEPFGLRRLGRLLSFFFFSPDGEHPLGWDGALFLVLVAAGSLIALKRPRARFMLFWSFGGLAAVETLLRLHPHWDVARIYLPAGIALLPLAAIALDALLERPRARFAGAALLGVLLLLDLRGLAGYFRNGRPDWRPLAVALRARPKSERIFTENAYTQLCLGFYVEGPQWLYLRERMGRDIWSLDGEIVRLTWSWKPGSRAWLVLGGLPEFDELRRWSKRFPGRDYRQAEGRARLVELEPSSRRAVEPGDCFHTVETHLGLAPWVRSPDGS